MLSTLKSNNNPASDNPLISQLESCLAGDEAAWRRLLLDYGPLLRKAIRWTLKHKSEKNTYSALESDADDIFQDVCFRLVRSEYRLLRTYDPQRSSFSTWLCVVARSATLDHLRNQKYSMQTSPRELDDLVATQESEGGMLSLPRDVLTARQAYVLHMCFEKDATTTEIAELMDVHPQTVRSMRNSALARMRWHYFGPKNGSASESKESVKNSSRKVKLTQRTLKFMQDIEII